MSKVFNVSFLHAKGKNQIRDGLMYRKKKLNKNQGMLFHTGLKVSSFWMKNTFIPLDVLFLNKSGKILGYKENNKPHSLKCISIGKKSFYVLEMNGGWVRENKVKVGDKIKIRNSRTRKKRGGVRRGRQYHPLETLASNEMLEFFRNPDPPREFVPTAMNRCRSEHTKRCLSELLNARGLPHDKNEFTNEQLEIYNNIIETCKPKDIAVPWNTQSGEGQGGGRKKKTRKKRGGMEIVVGRIYERDLIQGASFEKTYAKVVKEVESRGGYKWIVAKFGPETNDLNNKPAKNMNKDVFIRLYKPYEFTPNNKNKDGAGKRRRRTRKKTAGVKIKLESFWTRINPPNTDKDVWQVIGIICENGKGIIQIAKSEYGNTMMRSYEKENFFRLYKPFNDKPGGDTVPQIARKESGGDKICGGRKKKTRKKRGGQGEDDDNNKKRKKQQESSGSKPAKKKTSTPQVNEANRCGICLKGLRITRTDDAVIHCPACNGIFCRDCLSQWIQFRLPEVAKCPLCNALLPEKTYTTLGLTHPNQVAAVVPIAEIHPITALNVTVLNDIANPTMATGNQGEREILHMLRGMLQAVDHNQSPLVARHELMDAIRYIRWRAGYIAGYLGGNYNETNNRTPFLQALYTDYENLGGEDEYVRLNVITQLDSIGLDPHIQQDELGLYTQNRESIENAATVQEIYNILHNTIELYEVGPGQSRSDTTLFFRALQDDQTLVEGMLQHPEYL